VAAREPFRLDRRRVLLTLGGALVLGLGAIALLGRFAHYDVMERALRRADPVWFPVCLGGQIVAYVGYIAGYRSVARAHGGPLLTLWQATRLAALGFGAFVAGSAPGGLALDYWALHRAGESAHAAARRVLALNTLEWAILASVAALAALLALLGVGAGAPLGMALGWLIVVPLCVAAAAWVSAPARAERLSGTPPAGQGLRRAQRAALADAIGGVILVRRLVTSPRRNPGALLGFPLYWAGDLITLGAALRAFDAHVAPAPLVLAYTTAYVVTSLPLPLGGAGGVETGLALCLHAVGVALAPAVLATLVFRFFTLWLPIGPTLLLLPQARKLAAELPRAGRAGV
jgi:uncharacterized membrane protein YbhN (UPF0104 family)